MVFCYSNLSQRSERCYGHLSGQKDGIALGGDNQCGDDAMPSAVPLLYFRHQDDITAFQVLRDALACLFVGVGGVAGGDVKAEMQVQDGILPKVVGVLV